MRLAIFASAMVYAQVQGYAFETVPTLMLIVLSIVFGVQDIQELAKK